MDLTIYFNGRCSKSRATLELIKKQGVEPKVVNYLENPPTATQLEEIAQKLQLNPVDLVRFKEERTKELQLSAQDQRSNQEWFQILIENPMLLERPIVIKGEKAVLGRPPEAVLSLF